MFHILPFVARLPQALGNTISARQGSSNTATVDLSVQRGSPQHLASGFIYGIPDDGFDESATQIPSHFYSDIGFNYARAGGAQMSAGGWIDGTTAYAARFQLLPHDLWGTDHANSSTVWPGDDDDWTDYDNFLDRVLSDLSSNNMLDGLDFDIWNEPDGGFFWKRSLSQYYQLYVRTHQRIRSDAAFNDVLLVGPSSASQPNGGNTFWQDWLQTVVSNNVIPDQYTWHDEPGDVANDIANLQPLLVKYGAPNRTININEYAVESQQVSTGAAWWIARLERYDAHGLRGNWLGGCQLHDFMASLLGKSNTSSCTSATGYYGNGEFQVYKYYNQNMTGSRVQTTGSGDGVLDVYTTVDSDKVRTLTGVNLKTGTWYITIKGLTAVGLPASGTLDIQTWGFEDKGHYGEVTGPSDRGVVAHQYSGGSITFPIFQTTQDRYTAWAFEFGVA
ncbi:hypothetical protein NLU13_7133 [Sarocladium strictum]|uniref:Glycoside hydrolase family 39 protein n=1 Tax=Sarocladium strictum TaxID=5046 RepID=A0AA39GEP9_SARSR|nr:hypothetical protein NLU13_7133 [Sarocladium strictum]